MAPSASTPALTTVIALDVPGLEGAVAQDVQVIFQRLVSSTARQIGSVTAETISGSTLGLCVVLPPEAPAAFALRRLIAALKEFEATDLTRRVRALAHHGVVFRTENASQVSYMGSAIRSAVSALRRVASGTGFAATRDFVGFVKEWPEVVFHFEPLKGPAGEDGLCALSLPEGAESTVAAPGGKTPLSSADPDLLVFIKRRLAEDLGPFASALVENARRSAPTAAQLVKELVHEIDKPAARKKFEADVMAWLDKR